MSETIEVKIEGSKQRPRVVDVDAEVIAGIIVTATGAHGNDARRAANQIVDYLAAVFGCSQPMQ